MEYAPKTREAALQNVLEAAHQSKNLMRLYHLSKSDVDTVRNTDPGSKVTNVDRLLVRVLGPDCAQKVTSILGTSEKVLVSGQDLSPGPATVRFWKMLCCDAHPMYRHSIGHRLDADRTMLVAVAARSFVAGRMLDNGATADDVVPTTALYIFCGHRVPIAIESWSYTPFREQWGTWAKNMASIVVQWKAAEGKPCDSASYTRALLVTEAIAFTHAYNDPRAAMNRLQSAMQPARWQRPSTLV